MSTANMRVLQRLIMPLEASPDVISLYLDSGRAFGASVSTSALGNSGEENSRKASQSARMAAVASSEISLSDGLSQRHSVTVNAGEMRSLGTYFNAFPASYWRRWTPVREVTLSLEVAGQGQVIIYRSNARGAIQRVKTYPVNGETTLEEPLSLNAFGDGGWYWFDVYAGESEIVVTRAEWLADASLARENGTLSLAMTTMNKVSYCIDNITTIANSPEVREILDVMYVVDQGSDRLADHKEELSPLRAEMGDQLEIIEQGNIGGSGGFSRGMYEAATNGRSTYVVNTDDDIVIEPESLLRLKTFADYTTTPSLVGAHMFDLNNRSTLHTFGEIVDPWRTQPAVPHQDMSLQHDFAQASLRNTPWLHRRCDVDYNGWWMCLIPTAVVREIGLSLPVFIKWDDAEYGLRAKKAGYPTVSLPGAGTWHVSWADKDDLVGWQAYFHERNRIITALLHCPYDRGGRLIKESNFMDIKHILCMQYYTEAGRLEAQRDVLRGPAALHPVIGTKLPEIRAMAADYADAQNKPDVAEFPPAKQDKPPRKGRPFMEPRRAAMPLWTLKQIAKHSFGKVKEVGQKHPQTLIAHQDARWWRLAYYESALVSNAEGTAVAWYKRDPKLAREMLSEAARTHMELFKQWNSLRDDYQRAAADITSFAAWEKTFAANPAPARKGGSAK
ncbi:glycosyltransferase [Dermabacteraceae bacterium P7006]